MIALVPTDESFLDSATVVNIANNPTSMETLGNVGSNSAAGKGIANNVAYFCGELNNSFKNYRR